MTKKFYITTSIPYTNAPPHIGFAFEAIQADVVARYHRALGEDVYFLTGTDEHGLKTKRAAEELGKTPEAFADQMSQKFKDLQKVLNLSTDDFIRTSDIERHLPAVKKLWEQLQKNGDFYKKQYKGFYCPGCEAFKTDKDLVNGKCAIHQKEVEEIEEENYFFKLSKYLPAIKKIIEKGKLKIIPESKKNEILGMLENGLEDISFSRSKEKYWGFFVPWDESQIIYVWGDALPNYISAIGYADNEKKFKTYWPADVHCIGKDIVKFHAIYWPAMLLSLGLDLPKSIFVHGFITVNGQKISKSLGNVIDPFVLVEKYGADAVRYYLLREITPTEDGDFSYEKFEQRYNADLAGGIGNLLARTIALAIKPNFNAKKPSAKIKKIADIAKREVKKHLKDFKFNEALKSIWDMISFCDKYINEQKPWEGGKNASQVVSDVLFALEVISGLLDPFLPETAGKIANAVESKKSGILFPTQKH
ncbi:MAG: methionine--tRNA ligase [Candidatus Staskawiczbacteria bacterium RIFCSPLOWO2_01_FULL_40_39]|uniref:methionine--tRNA ligase n=1 Tax=Candidatus Staskawiczbacteria bacterium RIFCSPHIGHO2_01_FULL_39_25 TaxID=1802202 RepID=A0A1G2HNI8_9BACT|nr:MAG: methionine--tRNA ligase [Candidatus Staskawiczbacteria bacterium RIFCSPHIGHO2_01_FULL_39_25]OGZ73910.1 MAG: methionine--tRNA ligase [Candidatus Staskawiczbacteria bacterium RIFCSPLOWO2_01_FULL_40_39]OGZ76225.1 MAG: methionine--tRNA ligase [Candidatus Staskawiczbacteria bacterium RIFCSPLOWO2_02_FULL_39_8]